MRKVVISPGSRNAPLSLAFARTGKFEIVIAGDERVAGFIALGMVDAAEAPVGVITTSGSAVANLYPAVTEAFFREKNILLITADRPDGEAGNWTGQTIFQRGIFGKHVTGELNIGIHGSSGLSGDFLKEIRQIPGKKGPFHINIHFEEPFYPEPGFGKDPVWEEDDQSRLSEKLEDKQILDLPSNSRPMIILGQDEKERIGEKVLKSIIEENKALIYHDACSNEPFLRGMISNPDLWSCFHNLPKPSHLLSTGRGILSKKLRQYLTGLKIPQAHFGDEARPGDPFKANTFQSSPIDLSGSLDKIKGSYNFSGPWQRQQADSNSRIQDHLRSFSGFSEGVAINLLLSSIPKDSVLHIGNSMPVRYLSFFRDQVTRNIRVFCNRGTSGIDGSLSTAIGSALTGSSTRHYLIIGDQSFFYDSNAFWLDRLPSNLSIILLNNHGGGIFEMIDGPSAQPEFDRLFFNPSSRTGETIAQDYGLDYLRVSDLEGLETIREKIGHRTSGLSIFEIETHRSINLDFYARLKESNNG